MKKFLLTAAAGLSLLAAPLAASAAPYGHWDRDRGDGGAALAAGLFGFVLGATVAHSHPAYERDYGYDRGYGYDRDYSYYGYHQRCGWVNEAYRTEWGGIDYQQVWVCR